MPPRSRNLRTALAPRLAGLARILPPAAALGMRPLFAAAMRAAWGSRLEQSMRVALGADGYTAQHVRGYFDHLADLVAFSAVVFRAGSVHTAGLERFWRHDAASRERYIRAMAQGKGLVMAGPHLIAHEIMVGSTTAELPLTALVRKSPDAEYEALKQRWYEALGFQVVYRPPKGGGSVQALAEVTAALRVLRKGRVLAVTPDLLQKPGKGVPVRLFGREARLPLGPFFLAAKTGAPLMASFCHFEEGRYTLWAHDPLPIDTTDLNAGVADAAQRWASLFEAFVREHPDMWQFWLDKRWSRWLLEEPRAEDRSPEDRP